MKENQSGSEDTACAAQRRRFTAEYKLSIVREADRCAKVGEVAALLKREGLYSSHLAMWRKARDRGELLNPPRRGRKPKRVDTSARRLLELQRQLAQATARAERAEALVATRKKLVARFG